ncbi:translation initiation factor IF-2-like isoform X1 [Canis lupus familiaris]|uniref:translation initiation factor IF-2-like isoform X1 n=1 Tax=Canis lupus familiaris TaxID=9615 RepID=UPI0018F68A26|nr:translation initiation factor IF-2-like isoform X1 [Canis lupus familiaris]XP_038445223.1 translation initiation factor IF-2-like isoform X1 [Canis lupus familiaris]XP_038445224.1 translation initiation factor IF-2-like isoform X1 [Canis lupus familiaris]XP_038445225.1 translation initiation factor IF-2-like isoform X1 [Canis lupus familiaris]XP_038445226.1 translation initiation factor IF-2-like isoform X1 [Canis lupus familiaris]XP_038445227.1 translation initiation factor IF-2-like isofo
MILCLLGAIASDPEQHPEPPQEPTPALTVGPSEASGPDLFKPGMAARAECIARVKMQAAESKPMHVVVKPLTQCPDLEEPPAPLADLDEEQAPEPAIKLLEVPEQPPVSVEQVASAPEQYPEPPQEPGAAPTSGPAEASEPEVIEPVLAAGVECLRGGEMAPADSKPLQVLVTPLIHCLTRRSHLHPWPLQKVEQASVPPLEFVEGPDQPPASVEPPASSPEQQLVMAAAQLKPSPPLSCAVSVFCVFHKPL